MLENIGQDDLGYARRILNMLCVSLRPLTVAELSDGVAVELGEHPKFNPKRKLPDAEDIRLLLPGLIEISIETDSAKSTVRIGHFSVQEYLESDRISLHSVNLYAVQRPDAHAQLSCICLTYLLECRPSWGETDEEGSLTRYAMQYWHKHFANADCARYSLNSQILKLFHASEKFQDWAFFSNLDGAGTKRFDIVLPSPLYCASLVGASFAVSALLEESIDVNAAGGKHGTALQAASAAGHEECVRLLLDKGADFEGQSGDGGSPFSLMPVPSPLSVSSERGHYKVVRILLDKAADRNIRLEYGGALLRSSENGHAKVVQLLLDNNAEACTRWLPSALCAASAGGYQETAQLLLDRNTDVNEPYRTDVHIPSSSLAEAHQLYLQLYLTNNVAFHAQSGQFLTALQQAAGHGHLEIVQLLLDRNAEVNYQGGFFGTALQAASARGERQIVQLLLDRNSDVNSRAGFYGTALEVASAQGHREVVQLLLDRGADVNNQSEYYGSALQAASAHGHREIVQLLLDRNADVNSQRGHYGTALQAASAQNHEEIVQMLLKQPALGHREVIRLPAFKLLLAS
jgi:ankyrin repeat protein